MPDIDEKAPEWPILRLYELISGPSGQERPWDTIEALFLPGARLRRERIGKDGNGQRGDWSFTEFMEDAAEHFRSRGFWEREIARRTEHFGNIAHVLSTFETRIGDPASLPVLRGINSVQLLLRAGDARLRVKPFLDDREHGVFATRAPCRPNTLGISLVRPVSCRGPVREVEDIDVLDGTPLLDIKPYVTRFDSREDARCGWQDAIDEETARVRGRRKYDENR